MALCGDGWGLLEAGVVCRELGLGFASAAVQTDFFGGGASAVGLAGVACRGNESSLSLCMHDTLAVGGLAREDCPGRRENVAGVVCTHSESSPFHDISTAMLKLSQQIR